ncbi:MAG: polymorphic toxin type 24 domain-containing protein [Candidatus Dormibacteria bacterium]
MTTRLARIPLALLLALATLAALPASQASAAAPAPASSALPWAAVAFAGVHTDSQGHVDAAVVGVLAVVFQPKNRVKGKTDPAVLATLKTASLAALSELVKACGYDGTASGAPVYVNGDPVNLVDPSGHRSCEFDSGPCGHWEYKGQTGCDGCDGAIQAYQASYARSKASLAKCNEDCIGRQVAAKQCKLNPLSWLNCVAAVGAALTAVPPPPSAIPTSTADGWLLNASQAPSGKFPPRAPPNTVLYRLDSSGKWANYQVYGTDGLPVARADLQGRPHNGIDPPHVQEFNRNTAPDGTVYANKGVFREAAADEVPLTGGPQELADTAFANMWNGNTPTAVASSAEAKASDARLGTAGFQAAEEQQMAEMEMTQLEFELSVEP